MKVFEETGIFVKVKSLIGIYSNTRKPSILNMDFLCEYISGEPKTSAESSLVEWVDRNEVLGPVQRKVISKRLKNMLDFTGEVATMAHILSILFNWTWAIKIWEIQKNLIKIFLQIWRTLPIWVHFLDRKIGASQVSSCCGGDYFQSAGTNPSL